AKSEAQEWGNRRANHVGVALLRRSVEGEIVVERLETGRLSVCDDAIILGMAELSRTKIEEALRDGIRRAVPLESGVRVVVVLPGLQLLREIVRLHAGLHCPQAGNDLF